MVRKKGATDLVMQNSHFSVLLELSWMRKMHDFPIRKHTNIHMYVYMCVCVCICIPFSRGSSQIGARTQISCIAGRFFTIWTTRIAHIYTYIHTHTHTHTHICNFISPLFLGSFYWFPSRKNSKNSWLTLIFPPLLLPRIKFEMQFYFNTNQSISKFILHLIYVVHSSWNISLCQSPQI